MKILVVGGGGREHAILWRLSKDAEKHELFAAPGNAGTRSIATNLPIGAEDVPAIVEWAAKEKPDLVVVGPEAPLVAGVVDALAEKGIPAFGPVAAGAEVLIEEFLDGEECSILAMTDGETVVLLPGSQDHKRIFDGDKGPNTGGMGAYSPAPVVTDAMLPEIKEKIVIPVVRELARRGIVYRGILYAGLMVTPEGGRVASSGSRVNVVEFNARFGDPETEAVLPRLGGDFSKALFNAATGRLSESDIVVKDVMAATVIASSAGYPGKYEKGKKISGLGREKDNAIVFHCGTKASADGGIETSGGRVLSATGLGATLREAVDAAYAALSEISFEGMFFRRDIAHRAFGREGAK